MVDLPRLFSKVGLSIFSFGLGVSTAFVLRDELTMPTYMRIKMALVEHSILTRRQLSTDLLTIIDQN
jgi:hypothetical protein